MPLFAYNIILC